MVMRIFTVASAELISKPVSLVSMVRTWGGEIQLPQRGCKDLGTPSNASAPERAGSEPRVAPTFAGVLRPQALHHFVSQGRHGFHWGAGEVFRAGPGPALPPQPREGYSRVGRIFRITTRSATLCPVVMVPFL